MVTGLAQAVLLQRLLRPLHDWAMDVLRRLPCDGTFDQPKPLIRLTGRSIVSSCDLTAATDRWPSQLISQLVESWFGRGIATAAIDTCLVSNSIHILPPWSDKPTVGMQSDVSVNLSPTRGVLGGARKRLKMDEQDDIHTTYAKLYKVFEKHEKLYRLATKKLSEVKLDREELSTKFDEANQTIGALRFENNFLAEKTKKHEVELSQVRAQ